MLLLLLLSCFSLRDPVDGSPPYNSLLTELSASTFSFLLSKLNTTLRDTIKMEIRSWKFSSCNRWLVKASVAPNCLLFLASFLTCTLSFQSPVVFLPIVYQPALLMTSESGSCRLFQNPVFGCVRRPLCPVTRYVRSACRAWLSQSNATPPIL